MSCPQKGRKVRPVSGKTIPSSIAKMIESGECKLAEIMAATLRHTFGSTHATVKSVMAITNAGERTVKNWLEGKNAPNGTNLIALTRHSDEVLEVVLLMANRDDMLTTKKLIDARRELLEVVRLIDRLLGVDPP